MDFVFPVIFAILVIGLVALLLSGAIHNNGAKQKVEKKKDRQTIIRDANRKLAQDPHSPQGLKALADLYFSEHAWDKSFSLYNLMLDISAAHPEIDELTTGLRQGICAIKMGSHVDSFKGLMLARKADGNNMEVNYYLGIALYLNNDFEKAIPLLKRTIVAAPENPEPYRYLGLALSKARKFKESLPYLKKTLDIEPEDKEVLFTIAESLSETNSIERALRIFSHLRPDPEYGPRASLQAGILHSAGNQLDLAIQDFEIGMKHVNVPVDISSEIKYRLAQVYLKKQSIGEALLILKDIQSAYPDYKDVNALITQYQELNQNKNLQIYLIANNSDFVQLCKQIVLSYYKGAKVRIQDIASLNDNTEILTEVETEKWEDIVIFRFYRTAGNTGELYMRDFHSKIRDAKAGRGICFTAGTFTDEARKFIDGRPIDLIEKNELTKILSRISKIDTSVQLKSEEPSPKV